jgi:uncharacterized protein
VRLAILSDTHMPKGDRALPEGCVERLRTADTILHAGDLASLEVLEMLRALGPPVHAVHGNVDGPDVRAAIPAQTLVEAGPARIAMTHDGGPAAGRLERMRRRFPEADAVVFGHSHIPLLEAKAASDRHGGRFQIFNPGSPTERRRAPSHTMGLAHATAAVLAFELVVLD